MVAEWSLLDEFDRVEVASLVPDHPNGLMVVLSLIQSLACLLLGLGFFAHQSVDFWSDRRWGHVDHVRPEGALLSCCGFCSVPGLSSLFKGLRCGVSFFGFTVFWCGTPGC